MIPNSLEAHSTSKHGRELKRLVEIYAIQTRKLSEAVSSLGRDVPAEGQIDDAIDEVKTIQSQVEQAGQGLFAFVEPLDTRSCLWLIGEEQTENSANE
jgi:hypothetical protein